MLPNEPKPALVRPSCPAWLTLQAKREWRRIAKELEILGLLTRVDRAALAAYCQCYGRWWQAEKVIQERGFVTEVFRLDAEGNEVTSYLQQRPEVSISRNMLMLMKAFLTEFGMTPAARTRINAKPLEDKGAKTKEFLFGSRGA
jgi:P27 family predicted phage terminase small subunit